MDFLLKGPTQFREMTMDMCGKPADKIYRLVHSGADISIVQYSHQISGVIRNTLRSMTVFPGNPRNYCVIEGKTPYRLFTSYGLL